MKHLHRLSTACPGVALSLLAAIAAPTPAKAQASTPQMQIEALEGLFGKQPSFRRSHAKGVCASGVFIGNAAGRSLTTASVFSGEPVPVVARFSLGGPNPKASDKGRTVRGLAIAMSGAGGQAWQMATLSAPVFFVARPEQFAAFIQARTPDPATGRPDPQKLKAFSDAHPETLRQAAYLSQAPVPASFATVQYWSTNAFELVDGRGESRFVRFQFVPEAGTKGLTDDELKSLPDDFLADELRGRVVAAPVSFAFQFQLARAGDPITDPTQAWPDDRLVVRLDGW
jgi:catalase